MSVKRDKTGRQRIADIARILEGRRNDGASAPAETAETVEG